MPDLSVHHHVAECSVPELTISPDGGYVQRFTERCSCGAYRVASHRTDFRGMTTFETTDWTGGGWSPIDAYIYGS